jgi:uncharacterized protein YbbC (DUF1343 family)
MPKVKSGLDILVETNFKEIPAGTVAVLANQASIDLNLNHIVDIVANQKHLKLIKVFAPEHGFYGVEQDMAQVGKETSAKSIPVISLYGKDASSLSPTAEQLKDVEYLIVDLQDVGSRYYTYVQTLGLCMQVAKVTDTTVVVVDRPNPIGGEAIEGPGLQKSCRSFCGYAPVTARHGLTIGEFAELMNIGFGKAEMAIPAIGCKLKVLKMSGWNRGMYFNDTELPWVLPSPNMPTLETAIVYPGACLFEATKMSEARGTTRPFELLGAPGINANIWIKATKKLDVGIEGVELRACSFKPTFQKHANAVCSGLQIHVTERAVFKPYRLAISLLVAFANEFPEVFSWRGDAYEFVKDIPAIDLLHGSSSLRDCVEGRLSIKQLVNEIADYEAWYRTARKKFLMY